MFLFVKSETETNHRRNRRIPVAVDRGLSMDDNDASVESIGMKHVGAGGPAVDKVCQLGERE
jgi:hypothetical protein